MDILLRGNPETFLEVQNMARRPTFEEVFTEAGLIPEWMERGRKQGREEGKEQGLEKGKEIIARNLLKMGMSVEEIAQATELPVKKIRSFQNIDDC
jgi:predicted transposase/invertase (TIGR01784 family)